MKGYIEFNLVLQKPKTAVYAIRNIKSQFIIGYIQWHGPWRQYCLLPQVDTVWSSGCLEEVAAFIITLRTAEKLSKIKLHERLYPAGRYEG